MDKAKLFWTGRSQAVRLPKEFRFEGDEVQIRRHGSAVVLEPLVKDHLRDWAWLDELIARADGQFLTEEIDEPLPQQRPGLDDLFK